MSNIHLVKMSEKDSMLIDILFKMNNHLPLNSKECNLLDALKTNGTLISSLQALSR